MHKQTAMLTAYLYQKHDALWNMNTSYKINDTPTPVLQIYLLYLSATMFIFTISSPE